jgi:8-oxo-dGTP diphosphatase
MARPKIRIGVGGIVMERGKVLLVEHTKGARRYRLTPGGGVDFGESIPDALVREFQEELAITIKPGQLLWVSESIDPGGERHIVHMTFRCTRKRGGEIRLGNDKRLSDFAWFTADKLDEVTIYPKFLKQKLKELLAGKKPAAGYAGEGWDR